MLQGYERNTIFNMAFAGGSHLSLEDFFEEIKPSLTQLSYRFPINLIFAFLLMGSMLGMIAKLSINCEVTIDAIQCGCHLQTWITL